jgi:hypothetical protein
MINFNNKSTACQQGQAEKQQHYNMVVGSKSLTINKGQGCPKLKFKEEFYYDY